MSYCVEYNPEFKKYYPTRMKRIRKPPVKLLLAAILIAVSVYILTGTGVFRILLPGDPQVTAAAFSDMVQRVGTGEPVSDAVHYFFRDVIVSGMN